MVLVGLLLNVFLSLPAIDPVWLALIGTLFGGVGLKAAEGYFARGKIKTDDATQIRDELRETVTSQKAEIRDLEEARDKWRQEYYDLRDKYAQLQTELTITLGRIQEQAREGKETAEVLKSQPPVTP